MRTNVILLLLVTSCPLGHCAHGPAQAAAPAHVTVNQALSCPEIVGHDVALAGTVRSVLAVGTLGWFRLDDGTGTISVTMLGAVPRDGEHIQLEGLVHQVLVFGHKREIVLRAKGWRPAPPAGTSNKPAAGRR
jgi:hypothetical protein